jgi:hypothetical protein
MPRMAVSRQPQWAPVADCMLDRISGAVVIPFGIFPRSSIILNRGYGIGSKPHQGGSRAGCQRRSAQGRRAETPPAGHFLVAVMLRGTAATFRVSARVSKSSVRQTRLPGGKLSPCRCSQCLRAKHSARPINAESSTAFIASMRLSLRALRICRRHSREHLPSSLRTARNHKWPLRQLMTTIWPDV